MKNVRAHLLLALAMTLAGSSVVIGKVLTHRFPVFTSQTISLAFAIAVLIPCALLLEGNVFRQKISRRDLFLLFLQALTGMFLFRVFLLFGLRLTTAADSGIITSATPAVLCVLSFIFLGERITKRITLGILLCFCGIMLCFGGAFSGGTASGTDIASAGLRALGGNALVLLSVVCEALFTIFRKKNSFSHKPITSTLVVIVFAFFLFVLAAPFELRSLPPFAPMDLLPLVIYGVFCSALAYVLWYAGVAKVPVSIAASYTCMMPISSLVLSYFFLGEALSLFHLIGIAVCIGGIYVLSIYKPRKKAEALSRDKVMEQ